MTATEAIVYLELRKKDSAEVEYISVKTFMRNHANEIGYIRYTSKSPAIFDIKDLDDYKNRHRVKPMSVIRSEALAHN